MKNILYTIVCVLLLGAGALSFMGLRDTDGAKRILENNGYTEVKVSDDFTLGCAKNEIYRTHFEALSPAGKFVTGTVCKGIVKGSTIRFDD